jgi:hypothetical protein
MPTPHPHFEGTEDAEYLDDTVPYPFHSADYVAESNWDLVDDMIAQHDAIDQAIEMYESSLRTARELTHAH